MLRSLTGPECQLISSSFGPKFEPILGPISVPSERYTEAEFGFRKRPASKSNFHPGREHFFRPARCHLGRPKLASFPPDFLPFLDPPLDHFWAKWSAIFGRQSWNNQVSKIGSIFDFRPRGVDNEIHPFFMGITIKGPNC